MNYANIKYFDIANGPGIRTSLFVSGCRHHCKECFNKEAWNFQYGDEFTSGIEDKIIESIKSEYIDGLTLLGGEPMEIENQEYVLHIVKRVKSECPDKTIWLFSGFTFPQLMGIEESRATSEYSKEILTYCDVLVDGPFILEEKDISLQFRGSRNQRIIDLKRTLNENEIILWKDPNCM